MLFGGWGDKLTSYRGVSITYDTIGNPTAIGSATLTWRGRQLMQYVNGSNTYAYTYNDEGIRTSKTINGVKHTYHLSGSQIIAEEWGTNLLVYLYDESGSPIGMMYRNTTYAKDTYDVFFFEKNLQGDIVAVYNDVGTKLISYYYDAWGNVTTTYSNGGASTNAAYNPFKYRGYYHDSETGWYYLQSRYYNPSWGRFINADGYVSTGTGLLGYNMFAYCNNNPVMLADYSGEVAIWLVVAAVVAVVGVVAADHALARHAPEGVAVVDDKGKDGFHDRFLFASGAGPKIDGGDVTFVDFEAGLYEGTSITDFGDVSFATFLKAKAAAQADFTGVPAIEASANASIYTMSYKNTFHIFGIDIEVSGNLYVGYIGAGVEADFEELKFKVAPPSAGIGWDFGFDIDY